MAIKIKNIKEREMREMSMKKILLGVVILLFVFSAAACGPQKTNSNNEQNSSTVQTKSQGSQNNLTYVFATGGKKGTYYPVGNGIAEVAKKSSINLSVLETAGSGENIERIIKKEAQFGIAQSIDAYDAVNGLEKYKGNAQKSLKGIITLYPSVAQCVVTKASKISSYANLKGKNFAAGPANSGTERNSRDILSVYGLDYVNRKDVKVQFKSFEEAVTLFKEGKLDAGMFSSGIPFKAVQECFDNLDVKLLDIDNDKAIQLMKNNPSYFMYTIKAGTYGSKQSKDVRTVAAETLLVCDESVPEDVVYNLVKTIYDNHDELVKIHGAFKNTTLNNVLEGMSIPLHKGAIKYLTEKGIYIPDNLKS